MTGDRFDEIWGSARPPRPESAPETATFLDIRRIDGIEPPEGPGQDLPDALAGPLFGTAGALIHSYALLDAARAPGLPELLETSRLEHLCLFRGARDQVGQAAPWLVRLEPDHKLTRNLLRASDRPWHLWGKDCGIFLRSDASLSQLVSHFRRFTRVRDHRNRWVFFRFWDPLVAATFFSGIAGDPERIARFFRLSGGRQLRVIAQTGPDTALSMTPAAALPEVARRRAPTFDETDESLFRDIAFLAFARQLSDWLSREYPDQLGIRPPAEQQAVAAHVVASGRRAGLTMKEDFAFLAQMMMTSGGWFLDDACPLPIARMIADTPAPKAAVLADRYAGLHAATPQAELLAAWSDLRAHLAAIPEAEAVTPDRFREIAARFLPRSSAAIPGAIASTRARLRDLGLDDQPAEGRALVLTLLFGPRFFEDPLKPWSGQQVRPAIDAAWQFVTR